MKSSDSYMHRKMLSSFAFLIFPYAIFALTTICTSQTVYWKEILTNILLNKIDPD